MSERAFATVGRAIEELLGGFGTSFRLRLWDGREIRIGDREPAFTLVVHDRRTFRRVLRTTRTRALAEAFVADRVDVQGDLFAALRVAGALEDRRLGAIRRIALWRVLRRI